MNKSPVGSRLLAAYAIARIGFYPIGNAFWIISEGYDFVVWPYFIVCPLVIILGMMVLKGKVRVITPFVYSVLAFYFIDGVLALAYPEDFAYGMEGQQIAIPLFIRNVIASCVFAWYYIIRTKTIRNFERGGEDPTLAERVEAEHEFEKESA